MTFTTRTRRKSTVARAADALVLEITDHLSTADVIRIEPWPGREGELRAISLADGSFSAWIPAGARGLGCGLARVEPDGTVVDWLPAAA
ncbi:hypothetical protein GRS96_12230 [Rathayibacter sp. VKM Ac-2803]|uniref:hypothetical protein n=1 Tax=Rathayibacter sp. VKM Ac-2803 TaxID=2609256 RepID=UPI0013597729|nr:hypothetical protein [Rathayibacter sp. VKM Ac-2803]MWV50037.1 hypothetical protein [Rathayibacter sp. VKM Ac-2803]